MLDAGVSIQQTLRAMPAGYLSLALLSGRKSSAQPFMQYRNPVGCGPSSKTWPR
jgi:hypothetical protein